MFSSLLLHATKGFILLGLVVIADSPAFAKDNFRFSEIVQQVVSSQMKDPIWTTATGWTEAGETLLDILSSAEDEGLDPSDYHFTILSSVFSQPNPFNYEEQHFSERQFQLESLMTDAYLGYGVDLSGGRVQPSDLPEKWIKTENTEENLILLTEILGQNFRGNYEDLGLDDFRSEHPEYRNLIEALKQMRLQVDNHSWRAIASGPSLHPGTLDLRITNLRERLIAIGDHHWEGGQIPGAKSFARSFEYDGHLAQSVKFFQARHGLKPDGIIGPKTLAALNVSDQDRMAQIWLNLERMRWLPRNMGTTYIRVNIPDFKLMVKKDESVLYCTKAIVGRKHRPTPILSATVSSLVVNPYWNVPQKLARRDLLPKIKKDPMFLTDRNFKIYESWSPGAPELDPNLLDWHAIDPWDMAFKFRQSPGARNPLGELKFMFQNQFSVFIHDTNHKEGFAHNSRAFSSGCIRIENHRELGQLLLEQNRNKEHSGDALIPLLESEKNQWLSLPHQVPVHLVYLTCWADQAGQMQYREDIYGYDPLLAEALQKSLPAPDRARIDMDEVLTSVQSNAAQLESQSGLVQSVHLNAGHSNINGLSQ